MIFVIIGPFFDVGVFCVFLLNFSAFFSIFRVRNLEGVEFGTLERFVDMPASPVMVVKGETERWLPVTRQHLQRIDPEERCLWVDWPADF